MYPVKRKVVSCSPSDLAGAPFDFATKIIVLGSSLGGLVAWMLHPQLALVAASCVFGWTQISSG